VLILNYWLLCQVLFTNIFVCDFRDHSRKGLIGQNPLSQRERGFWPINSFRNGLTIFTKNFLLDTITPVYILVMVDTNLFVLPVKGEMMSVGKRLILLRKTLDINQSDLAMVMGCTQANVSVYEKDGSAMSAKYLTSLRNAYSVNLDWLLLGTGKMFISSSSAPQPNEQQTEQQIELPIIKGPTNTREKARLIKEIKRLSVDLQEILQKMTEILSE